MTERLARKGKVGAEEMNDVLDGLFTELLAVAYDDGAGLVKWGGDAVLLLFDGEDHAARACRAAMNMQRTIRKVGRISTSVGQIKLRMSVGIHSGTFHFFLVGDSSIHRELVIAGPASTQTVLMEQTAEAGEVAVSRTTAAAIDRATLGAEKGEAFLLRGTPDVPFRPARPSPDARGLDLAQLVPIAIRDYLLSGETQPEHRRVAAAFLEFLGTDDLLTRREPGDVATAIDTCMRVVQEATRRHEVGFFETDVARNAWRVMLIAGAPTSGGGDEDRMLGALRAVAEADLPLPVRIGTNAGHVFAGYFGPRFRKTYSVKGDAVNLAARVMAKAEAGQVLATSSVLDPATGLYETVALEPFSAKGKRKPVHAWSVGRRVGSRSEGLDLPLVGRTREMQVLRASAESAREGAGRAVEIVGQAGIGKTRLLSEFLAEFADLRLLRALCEPYQQGTAYRPFRAILRSALDVPRAVGPPETGERLRERVSSVAPDLMPWLPLLAVVVDATVPMTEQVADLGEEFRRPKLEEVTVALLSRLVTEPTVLSFEDVHWMDDGSVSLLSRISRDVASFPWIVCATRRDEETGFVLPASDGALSLRLPAFNEQEAENLISSATQSEPLRRHAVAAVVERAGGNPLFLRQLVDAARQTGSVEELPQTVESLVTVQIDQLPPFERRVLRYSAILGMTFPDELVGSLLEADGDRVTSKSWRRLRRFLSQDAPGMHRFRHALMRDAAYEGLPFRRRRELHARAGAFILSSLEDPRERAELLSIHFFEAKLHFDAWQYSRIAGERALAKYANAEAATFFSRAVDAGGRAGVEAVELARVLEDLGEVRLRMNEFAPSREAFARARRLLVGDGVAEAKLLYKEARVPYKAGRFADAVRCLNRGMKLVEESDDVDARKILAALAAMYAGVRVDQGRYAEAERWCRRIIEMDDAVAEKDALARAYYVLDSAYMYSGRVEEAVFSDRAIKIYEEIGDLNAQAEVISNSGVDAYDRGEWDLAIDLYERARELKIRLGDDGEVAICTANIAEIRLDQGRIDEAEKLLLDALRVARAGGYRLVQAFAMGLLGRVEAQRGRFEEAARRFGEARTMFEHIGNRPQILEVDARIAEMHVLEGQSGRALREAGRALEVADQLGGVATRVPLLHRIRAFALMDAGDLVGARAALEESLAAARTRKADHEVALTLEALGALSRLEGVDQDARLEAESRTLLDHLGVVDVRDAPLPAAHQPA
jgi:class 3 adenylate cyclase/tetratricopeptide (TPR) repeat protein